MDSRAFLNAARAVLSDGGLADSQGRIDNATLFAAIEARLGVEKLPRRAWARHLSSLGLKSTRWNRGKVRGWRLPDVNAPDVNALDVNALDVNAPDVNESLRQGKCRVRLPDLKTAGYTTKERLLEAIEKYPHLRPCPKRDWWWINWKACEKCDWYTPLDLTKPKEKK